jgi:hypothetical protein
MHKHAAVTALAIALTTMLALTVSAPLTPANANSGGRAYCDNVVCLCQSKCRSNLNWYARYLRCLWTDCDPLTAFRDIDACVASCGRMEGVEHLSPSALRARVKSKEAAHH